MAMQQCPNGHIYDDSKNAQCPYCGGNEMGKTIPLDNVEEIPPTVMHEQDIPETQPYDNPDWNPTMYKPDVINDKGIDPVRGWLVCLDGEKKGMDFRIHSEKNRIGRGGEVEINIDFDKTVSKGTNALLAYDNRNNKFFLAPSESKNNMYINNNLLLSPVELKEYDIIEIGQTKMIFRSFCNESFNWDKNDDKQEKK